MPLRAPVRLLRDRSELNATATFSECESWEIACRDYETVNYCCPQTRNLSETRAHCQQFKSSYETRTLSDCRIGARANRRPCCRLRTSGLGHGKGLNWVFKSRSTHSRWVYPDPPLLETPPLLEAALYSERLPTRSGSLLGSASYSDAPRTRMAVGFGFAVGLSDRKVLGSSIEALPTLQSRRRTSSVRGPSSAPAAAMCFLGRALV